MARSKSKHPTELELELLKILWREGELSVRETREHLTEAGRELAHTTLVTVLNVMCEKKYATRKAKGNSHLYRAKITQEKVSTGMTSDLISRVFEGSASALILNLLQQESVSNEEREHLLDLIQKHQNKTPKQ